MVYYVTVCVSYNPSLEGGPHACVPEMNFIDTFFFSLAPNSTVPILIPDNTLVPNGTINGVRS